MVFSTSLKMMLAQQLGLFAAGEIDALDLPVDVPFFVGEEEVVVAAAVDEGFLLQPPEAFFDPPPQGQLSASIWSMQSVTRLSTLPFISST